DADASETEKRLTVGLSWKIQRQAGTPKALSYAVESLGLSPNISAGFKPVSYSHLRAHETSLAGVLRGVGLKKMRGGG
ncbi:phage tail protein, partial [Pseudomonas sp. FG1]|nr:phage tail protein [Pseudomonas sp. FG1]